MQQGIRVIKVFVEPIIQNKHGQGTKYNEPISSFLSLDTNIKIDQIREEVLSLIQLICQLQGNQVTTLMYANNNTLYNQWEVGYIEPSATI